MKTIKLEDLVLAHQHLYYSGEAVISDYEYDQLEKAVKLLIPNGIVGTSVGGESENPKIIALAKHLKSGKYKLEQLIPRMETQ